jgi:hypothetical protein
VQVPWRGHRRAGQQAGGDAGQAAGRHRPRAEAIDQPAGDRADQPEAEQAERGRRRQRRPAPAQVGLDRMDQRAGGRPRRSRRQHDQAGHADDEPAVVDSMTWTMMMGTMGTMAKGAKHGSLPSWGPERAGRRLARSGDGQA